MAPEISKMERSDKSTDHTSAIKRIRCKFADDEEWNWIVKKKPQLKREQGERANLSREQKLRSMYRKFEQDMLCRAASQDHNTNQLWSIALMINR